MRTSEQLKTAQLKLNPIHNEALDHSSNTSKDLNSLKSDIIFQMKKGIKAEKYSEKENHFLNTHFSPTNKETFAEIFGIKNILDKIKNVNTREDAVKILKNDKKTIKVLQTYLWMDDIVQNENKLEEIDGKFGERTMKQTKLELAILKNNIVKNTNIKRIKQNIKQNAKVDKPYTFEKKEFTAEQKRKNAKIIADKLKAKLDLKDFQISGIIGSLIGESSLNPDAKRKGSRDFGICQWTNVRRKALYKFAGKTAEDEKVLAPIDLDTQINYMIKEMKTNRIGALNQVRKAKDIQTATNKFTYYFESPGWMTSSNMTSPRREKLAKQVQEKLFG
ncbi:hypothetical protein AGMMS50249_6560 [candidate division SR1 bacterium]|nr:hypothetical protein AGMMS50249_6560 [candidate division SR1 bacterium]